MKIKSTEIKAKLEKLKILLIAGLLFEQRT